MTSVTLADARIPALRPRKSAHDVRNGKLKGFGVGVLPSGGRRYFIHVQHKGERTWRIVGDATAMGVREARSRAAPMLAAIRQEGPSPATPVAADRSMPVLSVTMREAERMGFRDEGLNLCLGIPRYRRRGRERFLSDAEIRSIAACLDARAGDWPLAVAAIRLLLLTGARQSEILSLRWTDFREGALFLRDGKTGSRTVWPSRAARDVLDGMERTPPWTFPAHCLTQRVAFDRSVAFKSVNQTHYCPVKNLTKSTA